VITGQLDRDLSAGARAYTPRPTVAHKPDPYKPIIDARLEEFPKPSAKRLFDEVQAAGYTGGYVHVRDYVRARRPREPVEAVIRFETPAGRQGRVDFGPSGAGAMSRWSCCLTIAPGAAGSWF